jgi:hypothetical protein
VLARSGAAIEGATRQARFPFFEESKSPERDPKEDAIDR